MAASLWIAGALVLVLVLYRDATMYLAGEWARYEDGPYGHGFLVLAVALYLVYLRRGRILVRQPCPCAGALLLVAFCVLAWLVAALADVVLLQAIVLWPLTVSLLWALAGRHVTRELLFPVMFMVFALPVWSPLLPLLRDITAGGAFYLVRLFGITAYLEGYEVRLPAGVLSIEAACSGLNYLLAALTLGVFYAWLNYRALRPRLLVVAIAAGAALLANILRVFVIVYLAYITNMQHPFVADHVMLGWYLFGALVLVLLGVDHLLYRRRPAPATPAVSARTAVAAVPCVYGRLQRFLVPFAAALLVVSGPAAAWWLKTRTDNAAPAVLVPPPGQAGWAGSASLQDSWQPVYHGAAGLRREYHKHGAKVQLYVGFYPQQRQGSELINDLNSIANPADWLLVGTDIRTAGADGLPVIEAELRSATGQPRLVWYRYRVAGRYTTSRYAAKALQVLAQLGGQQGAAVIALASDSDGDPAVARRTLEDFLAAMEPVLARIADGRSNEQGHNW